MYSFHYMGIFWIRDGEFSPCRFRSKITQPVTGLLEATWRLGHPGGTAFAAFSAGGNANGNRKRRGKKRLWEDVESDHERWGCNLHIETQCQKWMALVFIIKFL